MTTPTEAQAPTPEPGEAANDGRSWDGSDDWLVCDCGCHSFHVMRRDNLNYVLCAQCEHDMTNTVWGTK